jgi:hypothetical protein
MLTRHLPATAVHQAPATRERRDYFYFALAIIIALAVMAIDVGVRDQSAGDAVAGNSAAQ